MALSKLETYLKILEILVAYPLELKRISFKADIEPKMLKKYLDFLVLHGLVEEQYFGKDRVAYAITDLGLIVLRKLQGQKYFERIRNILVNVVVAH